jgi:hypothetical protein
MARAGIIQKYLKKRIPREKIRKTAAALPRRREQNFKMDDAAPCLRYSRAHRGGAPHGTAITERPPWR